MWSSKRIGLAYVCARFHSGQWSRGYRLLCRIGFRPGTDRAAKLLPRDEWQEERHYAARYTRLVRRELRRGNQRYL